MGINLGGLGEGLLGALAIAQKYKDSEINEQYRKDQAELMKTEGALKNAQMEQLRQDMGLLNQFSEIAKTFRPGDVTPGNPATPGSIPKSPINLRPGQQPNDAISEVYDFYKSKGMPHNAIVGLLANLQHESGMNPTIPGDNGNSLGLFQFNGPRKDALLNYAKERNINPNDRKTQMEYAWDEMNNAEKAAYQTAIGAKTPEEAVQLWSQHYFRPGNPMMDKRLGNLASLNQRFQSTGQWDSNIEHAGEHTSSVAGRVDQEALQKFNAMAKEYYETTGQRLKLNDAWRSGETQAKAYNDYVSGRRGDTPVAKPGTSLHEKGLAFDLDRQQAEYLKQSGLAAKHGFGGLDDPREAHHLEYRKESRVAGPAAPDGQPGTTPAREAAKTTVSQLQQQQEAAVQKVGEALPQGTYSIKDVINHVEKQNPMAAFMMRGYLKKRFGLDPMDDDLKLQKIGNDLYGIGKDAQPRLLMKGPPEVTYRKRYNPETGVTEEIPMAKPTADANGNIIPGQAGAGAVQTEPTISQKTQQETAAKNAQMGGLMVELPKETRTDVDFRFAALDEMAEMRKHFKPELTGYWNKKAFDYVVSGNSMTAATARSMFPGLTDDKITDLVNMYNRMGGYMNKVRNKLFGAALSENEAKYFLEQTLSATSPAAFKASFDAEVERLHNPLKQAERTYELSKRREYANVYHEYDKKANDIKFGGKTQTGTQPQTGGKPDPLGLR